MFGAPRTASRAIAAAVSSAPSRPIQVSSAGSRVWSSRRSRRPSQASAEVTGSAPGLMRRDGIDLAGAASLTADAPPASRRSRGRARGAGLRDGRRPDHAAGRRAAGHAVHGAERRARPGDLVVRRRGRRRRRSRARRRGADHRAASPVPPSTRPASGPASRARRSTARTPTASRATSARSPRRSASTAAGCALATPIEFVLAQPAAAAARDAHRSSARAASPAR